MYLQQFLFSLISDVCPSLFIKPHCVPFQPIFAFIFQYRVVLAFHHQYNSIQFETATTIPSIVSLCMDLYYISSNTLSVSFVLNGQYHCIYGQNVSLWGRGGDSSREGSGFLEAYNPIDHHNPLRAFKTFHAAVFVSEKLAPALCQYTYQSSYYFRSQVQLDGN